LDKLVQEINSIRGKLDSLRVRDLKETPTRSIVVDPILVSLGWDVRDPDEVEMEYPTVDGKSVDYALKINGRAHLLVEAKPLDDPLTDVKSITQVLNYANNDGIGWGVLTNGITWKVYRSMEKCPAPEKLMFEVALDPKTSSALPVEELAKRLWRISRTEMAQGTLDALGEQVFTDGRVRKALDTVFADPPRTLVSLVRNELGDAALNRQRVRESITRVWSHKQASGVFTNPEPSSATPAATRSPALVGTRRSNRRSKPTKASYDVALHTTGKPMEVLELFRAVEEYCNSLPARVERCIKKNYIAFQADGRIFCSVLLQQSGLRIWLRLKYGRLEHPPDFSRDVSGIGHQGVGDLELRVSSRDQLRPTFALIRQSMGDL
jgi:hypothetical protein